MNITEITIHHETKFNDPKEQYRNHTAGCSLRATLDPGEDIMQAEEALRVRAREHCERQRLKVLALAELQKEFESKTSKARSAVYELGRFEEGTKRQVELKKQLETLVTEINELGDKLTAEGVPVKRMALGIESGRAALSGDDED